MRLPVFMSTTTDPVVFDRDDDSDEEPAPVVLVLVVVQRTWPSTSDKTRSEVLVRAKRRSGSGGGDGRCFPVSNPHHGESWDVVVPYAEVELLRSRIRWGEEAEGCRVRAACLGQDGRRKRTKLARGELWYKARWNSWMPPNSERHVEKVCAQAATW
jgi:hypothetical protein